RQPRRLPRHRPPRLSRDQRRTPRLLDRRRHQIQEPPRRPLRPHQRTPRHQLGSLAQRRLRRRETQDRPRRIRLPLRRREKENPRLRDPRYAKSRRTHPRPRRPQRHHRRRTRLGLRPLRHRRWLRIEGHPRRQRHHVFHPHLSVEKQLGRQGPARRRAAPSLPRRSRRGQSQNGLHPPEPPGRPRNLGARHARPHPKAPPQLDRLVLPHLGHARHPRRLGLQAHLLLGPARQGRPPRQTIPLPRQAPLSPPHLFLSLSPSRSVGEKEERERER